MQDLDKFNYLEVMITTDGGIGGEVVHRMLEGRNIWGTLENCGKKT